VLITLFSMMETSHHQWNAEKTTKPVTDKASSTQTRSKDKLHCMVVQYSQIEAGHLILIGFDHHEELIG